MSGVNGDNTNTQRVVGYVRVSTAQQAEGGVSLDAQRARIEAYAVAMDLELVAIHVDAGQSAKTLARPGLTEALRALEVGEADGLLVAKLDRLTRSVRDLGWLLERERFGERWSLLSVADSINTRTAAGRLVLNVLGAVSQWEREAIGERTREALSHVRAEGGRCGRLPLGLRRTDARDDSGRLRVVADSSATAALERAQQLRAGGESYRAIAKTLSAEGYSTARGGRWHASTVRSALARVAA